MTEHPQLPANEMEYPEDGLDTILDELGLAIKWQTPYLAMVVCISDYVRKDSLSVVGNFAIDHGQKVVYVRADENESNDVRYWFDQFDGSDDTVFFVEGLNETETGLDALRVLEHYRYMFKERNVRVVFWLTHKELDLLVAHAPQFWSHRNILVELEDEPSSETVLQKALESTWQGTGEYTGQFENMNEKISFRESILSNLPAGAESTSMRANLLLSLGLLNWRRGKYQKAEELLENAMEIAAHIQNNWFEAECFNALALLKTSLGKNDEAIDAYKQAIKLAPAQIFAWNNLGNLCLKIKRNDEAMIAFQKAVEHNPQDAVAWNGLGDVYTSIGYLDEAIHAYRTAIEHSPILHHPWNGLGDAYSSTGRFEDAEMAYRKAVQLNKNFVAAWIGLAHLYEKHDHYRDAIRAYQQALHINPGNAALWNSFGGACLKLGRFDEAVAAFTRTVDLDRGFGWAYSNLGVAYAKRGELRESIPFHLKSIELLSDNLDKAAVWNRLAEVYRGLDEYDKAVQAYRNADSLKQTNLTIDKSRLNETQTGSSSTVITVPETGSGMTEAGSEAVPEDDFSGKDDDRSILPPYETTGGENMRVAMPLLSRIFGGRMEKVREDSDNLFTSFEVASQWNERGNALFRKGAYEEAEVAYERAINEDYSFGWAYGNLGLAHLMQSRYGEAMILFQKSIELLQAKEDQSMVWNHLGNLYRLLNDYENAVVAYQTADQLDSGTAEVQDQQEKVHSAPGSATGLAWDELGDQFFEMGTYGEAANCYSKAIEVDPNNGFFYSNKALCLSYMGKLDEAVTLFERSLELFKEDNEKALVWNRIGNIHRKMKDYDKAMAAYQTAVRLNGEHADLVTRARFSLLSNCYVD